MLTAIELTRYMRMVPALMSAPHGFIWSSYDQEADVLYINFKKPAHATDSELTKDDIIVRYEGREIVGLTVLHASKRRPEGSAALSVRESPAKYKRRPAAKRNKGLAP